MTNPAEKTVEELLNELSKKLDEAGEIAKTLARVVPCYNSDNLIDMVSETREVAGYVRTELRGVRKE